MQTWLAIISPARFRMLMPAAAGGFYSGSHPTTSHGGHYVGGIGAPQQQWIGPCSELMPLPHDDVSDVASL
jgi:hypothetical protein